MKKRMVWLFILLILILSGCGGDDGSSEITGIQVFGRDQDFLNDYIPEQRVRIREIIEDASTKNITLISKNGAIHEVSLDSYLDKDKNSVFCIDNHQNKTENPIGIYLSENRKKITDVFQEAKEYLDNDQSVMVVLLDGFAYHQYKIAEEKGLIPFLSSLFKYEALSVYTPVTNAGFAAIITGQTPDKNGVHDRSVRQMETESIFGYANKQGKKSILLESDIKILNTEIEPVLHLDMNKDGDTDDEMFETALRVAREDYDFIFVHFHGIDDRGHSYGPESNETLEYIQRVDGYIEEISKVWNNSIILTADHGMHDVEKGGGHGECIAQDMVVPYFKK